MAEHTYSENDAKLRAVNNLPAQFKQNLEFNW